MNQMNLPRRSPAAAGSPMQTSGICQSSRSAWAADSAIAQLRASAHDFARARAALDPRAHGGTGQRLAVARRAFPTHSTPPAEGLQLLDHRGGRCATLRSPRSLFQNSAAAGILANRHPWCMCQKRPWTKTATLRPGMTMSGAPGRSRRWAESGSLRRASGGRSARAMFLPWMPAIIRLRSRRGRRHQP